MARRQIESRRPTATVRSTPDKWTNRPSKYQYPAYALDREEPARGYQVSTLEPWNKKQPIMISKDAAPIISFPTKNPTIGTVNTA